MKKIVSCISSAVFSSLFVCFSFPGNIFGQAEPKADNQNLVPENLNTVFHNSCTPCHWAGGGFKSTFHVNFSKWTNYKPDKKALKAKQICSVLLKDDMPPASARKTRPDIVPTKDQIDAICKWSANLKVESQK